MSREKKAPVDFMDSVEHFGDVIGRRLSPKNPWVIKGLVMGVAIVIFGGVFIFYKTIKKATGSNVS